MSIQGKVKTITRFDEQRMQKAQAKRDRKNAKNSFDPQKITMVSRELIQGEVGLERLMDEAENENAVA